MSLRSRFWPAYRKYLQSTDRPIFVGPFRGEVGFEALYWLPWLAAQGFDVARLIPITRGGAGTWYGTAQHVEIYALRDPKDVRIENRVQQAQTGLLKQMAGTAFDAAIVTDAAKQLGLTRYHVLHPKWMYRDLQPFWAGHRGLTWLWPRITATERSSTSATLVRVLRPPTVAPLPEAVSLPERFVVARFYLRSTFPHASHCLTTAQETIKRIAQKQTVILLNSGMHTDEHIDLTVTGPNCVPMSSLMPVTPQNNLALQAALIAKSEGFVGTYGGLAQLALRYRKPVVSFYSDWQGTAIAHKHLADAMAIQQGTAFLCLRIAEIPLVYAAVPELRVSS